MPRFVLDEQFPATVLDALGLGVPECQLVYARSIDKKLSNYEDWELLLEIHHLGGWDGLVTLDCHMLLQPKEVAVIHQTHLTVVGVDAGEDPVRAAGLLLVHLPMICKKTTKATGQVWRLAAASKNHEAPWELLKKIADHSNTDVKGLFHANKLTKSELKGKDLGQQVIASGEAATSSAKRRRPSRSRR